jgi:hypothetical protein
MVTRRSRTRLERQLAGAKGEIEAARAHYALALFHDNNSRETDAIPHYETALTLGVDETIVPYCLAYLASSLHKTGRSRQALRRALEAEAAALDPALMRFLASLKLRIAKALAGG